jgi:hypothetical protein
MGPILAERLFLTFADDYQSGAQYLNLGYLQRTNVSLCRIHLDCHMLLKARVLTFTTSRLPLLGVSALAICGVIVIMTRHSPMDQQTTSIRGAIPFVVISV